MAYYLKKLKYSLQKNIYFSNNLILYTNPKKILFSYTVFLA